MAFVTGSLSTYDREDTLGEELGRYDPDNQYDREFIIINYCLVLGVSFTYRHKHLLFRCLEDALADERYNFDRYFEHDLEGTTSFPWDVQGARVFFEEILRLVRICWKSDLEKSASEDPKSGDLKRAVAHFKSSLALSLCAQGRRELLR